jgi:hypothetical protein
MTKNSENMKFVALTFNNILNLLFPTIFFFILIFSGRNVLSSEIAINTSLLILLTKSLTANQRSIAISSGNLRMLDNFISFRIAMLIPILIFGTMANFYFLSGNRINTIFIFIICAQWINEVSLVKNELSSDKIWNKIFLIINIIFFITIFFSCFYYYDYIFTILAAYLFHIIIFSIVFLKKNYLLKFFLIKESFFYFFQYIKTNFFLSGFSLNFANLIWRISIVYLVGKANASIFFAIFSIGSFPGTVFNSSFGATMLKKKISNFYLIIFFFIYIFLLLFFFMFLLFFFSRNLINFLPQNIFDAKFLIYIISSTLIGSLIILFSLYNRQSFIIEHPSVLNSIYKKDIILSTFICTIPVLLFSIGGIALLGFSYLAVAIVSYFFYIR